MDSKLFSKVVQRVKAVTGIKAFLIFPVATLYLAVVAGCVRADKLVADTQIGSSDLKQGG